MTTQTQDSKPWPSGPAGLERVPAHWSVGSLRNFAEFTTGWTPPTGNDAAYDGELPWANISDLTAATNGWIDSTTKTISTEATEGREPCRAGDVLFAFKLSVGATARARMPMFTNEAIAVFRPSPTLDPAYAVYALPEFLPLNANTNIYGAKLLNSSLMKAAPVALPPLHEQRAIADYLDRETAQIDTLIEEQQRLLKLIDERRQGLLAAAFADLPRTSSISRLAGLDALRDGDWVESKDQDPAGEVRLLQLADVGDGVFKDRSDRRLNLVTFERLGCSYVLPGDILIARLPDPIGRACIVPEGLGPTNTVVDVAVLRVDPTKVDRRFAMFAINELQTRSAIEALQGGATRQRVARKALGRVPVAQPDFAVQRAVADKLERSLGKLDELTREASAFIELSKERRAALIAAAVTGQINLDVAS